MAAEIKLWSSPGVNQVRPLAWSFTEKSHLVTYNLPQASPIHVYIYYVQLNLCPNLDPDVSFQFDLIWTGINDLDVPFLGDKNSVAKEYYLEL